MFQFCQINHLSNHQDDRPIQPGEFRDVDAPGGNLRDAFMTLPFKEPSQTLLQLMGVVVSAGQRFASIADLQVGDGNQQAAVGTTVAMLERGSRTMSAIHKRLYAGMKREFNLLFLCFSFSLGFKLKPKSNQFIPSSTKESLSRLRLSIGMLTIIGLLDTTMIVLTELSSDIPNVLNAFWGMLMMFIVIFYYLDIRAYNKLKRSIV